jgi:hypothetical protein
MERRRFLKFAAAGAPASVALLAPMLPAASEIEQPKPSDSPAAAPPVPAIIVVDLSTLYGAL